MQAQQAPAPASMCSYFNERKVSNQSDMVHVEGTNTMIFNDYGKQRSRGIRKWEKVQYENYDRRARDAKFFEDKKKLEQLKNKKYVDSLKETINMQKQKALEDENKYNNYMKELQKMERVVVDIDPTQLEGNDAW